LSFDLAKTRIMPVRPETWPDIAVAFAELARSATEILDREHVPEADRRTLYGIDARYEGQNFEVHVALDGLAPGIDADAFYGEFARRFGAAHRAAYGYDIPGRAVEIVTLRLKMIGAVRKPRILAPAASSRGGSETGWRPVYFDRATGWVETPVHDRDRLPIGAAIAGPAVIEEMSATTLLHPGQHATTDAAGNLIVTVVAE
jgi:N-methylhydantoinase A